MNWETFFAAAVWATTILCGFTMIGAVISASDENNWQDAGHYRLLAIIMAIVFIIGVAVIGGMGWFS